MLGKHMINLDAIDHFTLKTKLNLSMTHELLSPTVMLDAVMYRISSTKYGCNFLFRSNN